MYCKYCGQEIDDSSLEAIINCALFASCGALETAYYIRDG